MAWQVGEKLKDGRYTIEQVLGHSGFGQTYVALRNTSNSERVVLKHLKKEDGEDDKTFRDRQTAFTNEAMRLASCKHPHIVKVCPETFWEADFMHMVMEHIEGENLAILVKQLQQPFAVDEALRYIGQVASALDHIHNFDSPLIHRDVKPANIVLRNKKPEAVLVDFGSAKEVRTGATLSIKSIGSGGYSPMEIYTGQPKHTYTDVYSLGATLYFLLTATHPMSAHERSSRKDDNLIPPIEHNSNIPVRVNNAIIAAMERYAEDRVQTVMEFMQRLGQPLKPSIIHQGLGLFGAKVAPSNSQADKQIAEQVAKIAAAEKQANLERQRREQAEWEVQEINKRLHQLEADKQRLAREHQKAEIERQQRQLAEREAQVAREQLQQSEAEKQRLAAEQAAKVAVEPQRREQVEQESQAMSVDHNLDSSQWLVVAVSLVGTSHQKWNLPCQDAYSWHVGGDRILVAGVADGAGSVSLSEVGSLLAVQTAVKGITSKIADSSIPDSDEGWKVLLNSGLEDALVAIQEEAESRQVNMRELSTTLLIAIATPEIVAAIQVGDGAIVVANQQGTAIALTSPPIEESLDLATFLTSPNGIDSAQICLWEGKPAQLAMFSDGLQMLALQMPQGVAHAPFFAPLFKFIAEAKDLEVSLQELTGFLQSPRVCDHTNDDLTLLLASLTS